MSLAKKISDDVKSALKGGDKKKLSIARYVYSELKNFLIKEDDIICFFFDKGCGLIIL